CGRQLSRPLEPCSSGQQAFAYTRARLALLDDEQSRPANRLIVLDEFGAFIAHDWLASLMGYLRGRAEQHPEDQVLIVLPLSRDYEESAKTALDPQAAAFARMAREVAERGYRVR